MNQPNSQQFRSKSTQLSQIAPAEANKSDSILQKKSGDSIISIFDKHQSADDNSAIKSEFKGLF